ncbi:MAG: hypothetical protein AAGF11_56095 [Myxococcota bacterium]
MNPHPDGSDYLAAFRRERPGAYARRRNWRALKRRIAMTATTATTADHVDPPDGEDDEGSPSDAPDLRRLLTAVGLTFAIAASALLMIRGVSVGLTATRDHHVPTMEAVDQARPSSPHRVTPARPARSARPSTQTLPESSPPEIDRPPGPTPIPVTASPRRSPDPNATPAPAEPTRSASPTTGAVTTDALAAETRLLAEARRALAEDDLAAALAALQQHARKFPTGALQEERLAYEAIVRCRQAPPSSTPAGRFFERYPSSPHGPRVRAACRP